MNSRSQRITTATALFLIFSVGQVYAQVSLAQPHSNSFPAAGSQLFAAILTTRGNQPIKINGASTISGSTILTGATIETPGRVGAVINLGSLGVVDIAPSTRLTLEFDHKVKVDQKGYVKVTMLEGCAILRATRNTAGDVETPQGTAGLIDPATGGVLDICLPAGAAAPTVNTGAAAAAGAGTAQLPAIAVAAVGMSETAGAIIGAIGGGAMVSSVLILPCDRGTNPSPHLNTQCR